ncbi:MAG: flavin reductase family protein [Pseudomonadales bacterium]
MEADKFDPKALRNALGTFATGVTVITTLAQEKNAYGIVTEKPVAMTANSFASVSLDPPLILWSIAFSAQCYDVFDAAGYFAVHILHGGQIGLSDLCATKNVDKFAGINWHAGIHGIPILDDYNACFQCSVENKYSSGDHLIIIGRICEFDNREKETHAEPLLFYGGSYQSLAQTTNSNRNK